MDGGGGSLLRGVGRAHAGRRLRALSLAHVGLRCGEGPPRRSAEAHKKQDRAAFGAGPTAGTGRLKCKSV